MRALLLKEIGDHLYSHIAWFFVGTCLTLLGLILWVFPQSSILEAGYATLRPMFDFGPYLFLFLCCALTMRSFAEESRNRTLELILTLPVGAHQIVLSKFLATSLLVLLTLGLTGVYLFSLNRLSNPPGNLDSGAILSSYCALLLLAGTFLSVGLFCSSLSPNQIVSLLVSGVICWFLYEGMEILSGLDRFANWSWHLKTLGLRYYYLSMSRGLLSIRDATHFLGLMMLFLGGTWFVLETRRIRT